jgi:hypothetical protein
MLPRARRSLLLDLLVPPGRWQRPLAADGEVMVRSPSPIHFEQFGAPMELGREIIPTIDRVAGAASRPTWTEARPVVRLRPPSPI